MSYLDMVTGLVDAEVRFIVCGGVAVAWHGSSRVTDDLDILYEPGRENTKRLARVLAAWHAYPRGMEPGLPWAADEQTLRQATMYTLATDAGSLDVFREMAGVGTYGQAVRSSVILDLEGRQVRALSIEQLISAKRQAGRPKDREDILTLEALAQLSRESELVAEGVRHVLGIPEAAAPAVKEEAWFGVLGPYGRKQPSHDLEEMRRSVARGRTRKKSR